MLNLLGRGHSKETENAEARETWVMEIRKRNVKGNFKHITPFRVV